VGRPRNLHYKITKNVCRAEFGPKIIYLSDYVRSLRRHCPLRFGGGPKPVGLESGLQAGSDRASFSQVYPEKTVML
jgi:hypothetical protein